MASTKHLQARQSANAKSNMYLRGIYLFKNKTELNYVGPNGETFLFTSVSLVNKVTLLLRSTEGTLLLPLESYEEAEEW